MARRANVISSNAIEHIRVRSIHAHPHTMCTRARAHTHLIDTLALLVVARLDLRVLRVDRVHRRLRPDLVQARVVVCERLLEQLDLLAQVCAARLQGVVLRLPLLQRLQLILQGTRWCRSGPIWVKGIRICPS